MAILDKLKPSTVKGPAVPHEVDDRIRRARETMLEDSSLRRLCVKFERGDTYWFLNNGVLDFQSTVTTARGGKPPHRVRNKYNFIRPIVQGKVSQATQRTPSYQILPTTTDPDDIHAAELSVKVALFGYDKWMLRHKTIQAVTNALVGGEGFVMPYWDPNVGPFTAEVDVLGELVEEKGKPKVVGQGEVKHVVLNGNEVGWEPGTDFYESPYWFIERARPIDEVEQLPGFVGGSLKPDASTSEVPTERKETENLVLLTEYLERPCPKYPKGRRILIANKKVICPVEDYPATDAKGRVVDEPVIHKLSWTVEPVRDRDSGLVEQLIDFQRTVQDCLNKIVEWKNRCLNPKMLAPYGSDVKRMNDVPGEIHYYNPVGTAPPSWEKPPAIPAELFSFAQMVIGMMKGAAFDSEAQAEADLAAKTLLAAIEEMQSRWQAFMGDLAEFHSRVMRGSLAIVARRYSEDRLVQIMGEFGPDLESGFRGADLRSQVDVRVFPQSLKVLSQEAIEARATNWATMGWISPAAAMRAINAGSTEGLMQGYEKDVARANKIISLLRQGPEAVFSLPQRWDPKFLDPETGQVGGYVPGWMPREFDDVDVQLEVFTSFLKGSAFDRMEPGLQEACFQIYEALKGIKAQREFEAAVAQQQMAEGLGMANAGKPQLASPLPDQPGQQNNPPPSA